MKSFRPFQIVLIGVFSALAVGGFIFLAFYNGSFDKNPFGNSVVIWGTFENKPFRDVFQEVKDETEGFTVVQYVQKDPRTFDAELTSALAEGRAPDLVVLPHETLVKHRAKMTPISFETLPQRVFKDTYVDGAEIFMLKDGVYGLPLGVDPLVMYWNRDILSSSGVAAPPKTWEELVSVTVPRVTRKNTSLDIMQSAVALGEYRNIRHAKKILSMLLLQSGSSIVHETDRGYEVTLQKTSAEGLKPVNATLSFYTQFALPSHSNYSWNRSFEDDHLQFLAEELGIYFAAGTEYEDIARENPNLNYDIARVPQNVGETNLRDYGTFYAFSIPKASDNQRGAFLAAQILVSESVSTKLTEGLDIAPVHRAELARNAGDPYRQVLYDLALISRGWLDPEPSASEDVFRQMVEDVTSGRERINAAAADAIGRLEILFRN